MIDELINFISYFEGCKLKAYKCPAGVWTIGYGRTKEVKEGDTCTQEQADKWFEEELLSIYKNVHMYNHSFTLNQLIALTSFCYNCGYPKKMVERFKKGDLKEITQAMLLYIKVNGVDNKGLINRRKKEVELFNQC